MFDVKWSSKPKKKTEVVPCHLGTTISMSKIYLASQRNYEHHFILYALYACEEVLQL